jgi:hypothetical protein
VEHRAAHELHVEVPHVQHAPARLADDRKGLGLQIAQGLALFQPIAELGRLGPKLIVRKGLDRRLERVDLLDERAQPFQFAFVLGSDDFCEESTQQGECLSGGIPTILTQGETGPGGVRFPRRRRPDADGAQS